jgi:PDZ domain-containing protein
LIPYDRFPVSRRAFALIPIAALVVAVLVVPLPYYSEGPGPAREVEPRIHVSGATLYQSQGKFVLTSVSFLPLTLTGLVDAWLDPAQTVLPESALVFPGETQQHADQRAVSEMDQSKIDATYVVFSRLEGYPERHGPGVLVESIPEEPPGETCPADGELFPGDLIQRVNGHEIGSEADFERVIKAIPDAEPVTFRVSAGGQTTNVTLTRRPCGGSKRPLIGISTVPNFPDDVSISSGDIGGPSAGTMWALGMYDLLTPGDLTGGRTIAGTGTISADGTVGPIGGVQNKIVAAKRAGADVFLVPRGQNYDDAKKVAGDLPLVPISSFQDALDYLRHSG